MRMGKAMGAVREVGCFLNSTLMGVLYSPTRGGGKEPHSHQGVIFENSLAEMVSEDSGYWDYALLMYYDEVLHSTMLSGLAGLTNFGWAERAALLTSGALVSREAHNLANTSRSLSQTLASFGRNIALALVVIGLLAALTPSFH